MADILFRTYGDEEGGEKGGVASSAASVAYRVGVGEDAETMELFKWPVVRQYFHRGLLWRSAEETEVMSFELFLDLLYGRCSGLPVDGLTEVLMLTPVQSASLPSTATMLPRRPMASSCCGLLSPLP